MSGGTTAESTKQSSSLIRKLTKIFVNPAKQVGIKDVQSRETVLHQGWLRKKNTSRVVGKAMDTMNMKWNIFYVLVTDKSIYYFKTETSSSFVGKFSLFGYNVVRRVSVDVNSNNPSKWPEHSMMIEHASGDPNQYKNYYFACAHYDEWKIWMQNIRKALIKANDSLLSSAPRPRTDGTTPIDVLEDPIYPSKDFFAQVETESKHDAVDSDDEDYEVIKDLNVVSDHVKPLPPLPKKPAKTSISNASDNYIDFQDSPTTPTSEPRKHRQVPLPPTPSDAPYQDHSTQQSTPLSPSRQGLPKFLNVESSPANSVLSELQEKQRKIKSHPSPEDSMPRNPAPSRPGRAGYPYHTPPHPTQEKPLPPAKKPVLPVKPRVIEKIYWNGTKDEATRVIRESTEGTFLVRNGASGKVLVVSAGEGESHSLKINNFSDGQMGLKQESGSLESEKFSTVESLVKNYKENDIHLRNGTVAIRLKTSYRLCDSLLQ